MKRLVLVALMACSSKPPPSPVAAPAVVGCSLERSTWPAGAKVLAAGGYTGRSLAKQLDQSGHNATQVDVAVTTRGPVVLLLGAYEPTVWNIRWAPGTTIVGVVAVGYHTQALAGLPRSTPRVLSDLDGPCDYAYEENSLAAVASKAFDRGIDLFTPVTETGVATLGPSVDAARLKTSSDAPVDSVFPTGQPLAGPAGIEAAVKRGELRPADDADIATVTKALAVETLGGFCSMGTYVVTKAFVLPEGLFGAHASCFIVPKGVPAPTGNPGHSVIYNLNASPICGPHCD